jgi:hypothetical protein
MAMQPEIGSRHPNPVAPETNLRAVALVELIATVTLALCTLLVATAVSIGLSRAEFAPAPAADMAPFTVSLSPTDYAASRS